MERNWKNESLIKAIPTSDGQNLILLSMAPNQTYIVKKLEMATLRTQVRFNLAGLLGPQKNQENLDSNK